MKEFSDLNIQIEQTKIFEVPQVTIDEILNERVAVLDFQLDVETRFGGGRSVILLKKGEKEVKLFTDSKRIKTQLEKVDRNDLPFMAKVTVLRFGEKKKSYQFA